MQVMSNLTQTSDIIGISKISKMTKVTLHKPSSGMQVKSHKVTPACSKSTFTKILQHPEHHLISSNSKLKTSFKMI